MELSVVHCDETPLETCSEIFAAVMTSDPPAVAPLESSFVVGMVLPENVIAGGALVGNAVLC